MSGERYNITSIEEEWHLTSKSGIHFTHFHYLFKGDKIYSFKYVKGDINNTVSVDFKIVLKANQNSIM